MTQNNDAAEANSPAVNGDNDVLLFRDGDDLLLQGAPRPTCR